MEKLIIASGPVIIENNKALLDISGEDEYWKFCGGRVGPGESLRETAKLRAKEELGIDIVFKEDKPYILYIDQEKNDGMHEVILVHWLCAYEGEVKPGKIVKEWKWIGLDELDEYDLAPNIKPVLDYYLNK